MAQGSEADVGRTDASRVRATRRGGAGGREAFGELVDRHQYGILRLLTHLVPQQAEDVAQETFARAYLRIQDCDPEAFGPWLRAIARNLAFNAHRGRKRRDARHDDYAKARLERTPPVARTPQRLAIDHVLGQLSYPFREILILKHVEELEHGEIAALLDISVSAAKMRLKRARAEFVERYTEATDGISGPKRA